MIVGAVLQVLPHCLIGWAADTERPSTTLDVIVTANGEEWGRAKADGPAPASASVPGDHGFVFHLPRPIFLFTRYKVLVRARSGDRQARVAQLTIERSPEPIAGPQPGLLTPVLLTASGRTGTTLLMHRLTTSPSVAAGDRFPFEIKLLTYYTRALEVMSTTGDHMHSVKPKDVHTNLNFLGLNPFHHRNFEYLLAGPQEFYAFFQDDVPSRLLPVFAGILSDFYRKLALSHGKPAAFLFAEKGGLYLNVRQFIHAAFPERREIVLTRDPRDTYCSYRMFWKMGAPQALGNLKGMQNKLLELHRAADPRALFVRYEDLVQMPEDTMQRIASFLGLPEPIIVDPEAEAALFARHATTSVPTASVGRWRRDLGEDEQALITQELARFIDTFGY